MLISQRQQGKNSIAIERLDETADVRMKEDGEPNGFLRARHKVSTVTILKEKRRLERELEILMGGKQAEDTRRNR